MTWAKQTASRTSLRCKSVRVALAPQLDGRMIVVCRLSFVQVWNLGGKEPSALG